MKQPIVNIDRNWTRLVWFARRLLRMPIVSNDRPKVQGKQ